jgi:hypothetical protein
VGQPVQGIPAQGLGGQPMQAMDGRMGGYMQQHELTNAGNPSTSSNTLGLLPLSPAGVSFTRPRPQLHITQHSSALIMVSFADCTAGNYFRAPSCSQRCVKQCC